MIFNFSVKSEFGIYKRTCVSKIDEISISRRDRQLVAETHRRASRFALQAPIVALYTGSVLEGGWSARQILAVVPGGIQSVAARPAAADRSRTSRTAVSIDRMIIVRFHRRVKITIRSFENGRGNRARSYIRDR